MQEQELQPKMVNIPPERNLLCKCEQLFVSGQWGCYLRRLFATIVANGQCFPRSQWNIAGSATQNRICGLVASIHAN